MSLPALHGNWVDLVIILFVVFYVWEGWGKGFITHLLELLAFTGAFVLALKLYPFAAKLLEDNFSFPRGLANAAGFFVLGVAIEQVFSHTGDIIHRKIPNSWHRHPLNHYLSAVPLTLNAIVVVAFVVTLALGLPIQSKLKSEIASSKLGTFLSSQTQQMEKGLSHIFGEAFSDTMNFITVTPISGVRESVKLNFTQHELSNDAASEQAMFEMINLERERQGVPQLIQQDALRDVARAYARDMLERGFFSHYNPEGQSPFDRMVKAGITYQEAGENLALAPSLAIAHQGLMESKGHRENILNRQFRHVGIGVVDGGIYGKMFVQEFTD